MRRIPAAAALSTGALVALGSLAQAPAAQAAVAPAAAALPQNSAPAALPAAVTGTFTGARVSTRFGPVQLRIRVVNGRVTSVTTPAYPTGRSYRYTRASVPILVKRALVAQKATSRIAGVSGATVTSNAFRTSYRSALAKARLV